MNERAELTKRESEIAELLAWGASKQRIAKRLYISERTVENHTRNIYEKTECSKASELSAWWFCKHFNISFDLSPLKQQIVSLGFLLLLLPQALGNENIVRLFGAKPLTTNTCRTRNARMGRGNRSSRRKNNECEFDYTI